MNIIPTPKMIQPAIDEAKTAKLQPVIAAPDMFLKAANAFAEYAEKLHGIAIKIKEDAAIRVIQKDSMEKEAYRVEISADSAIIYASHTVGANHGFASLLQMMQTEGNEILLPEVTIEDRPDCIYRGMMVDLARDWHPFPYLLSYVDMCYFYKVAVLQLHFTDDQSYTLPTKLYPGLSTKDRHYTAEQIQELTEYAHARGVDLMPEIDVPGHCKSFDSAYGELFGTGGVICQHTDSMEAMKNLFRELCDMFPYSTYVHIGGDEAYGKMEWTTCPKCCEYAKSVGIDADMEDKKKLAERLYVHFISEMADACFEKGKQPVVWEGFAKEFNEELSKDIIVMSWENYYQPAPDLLEGGFKIINCSWIPMYVVTPGCWSPEEVFRWSIYRWTGMHPQSPYRKGVYEHEPTSQILGGQLLAWGDNLDEKYPEKYPNAGDGISDERRLLMERLPMLAENTWNIKKVTEYAEIHPSAEKLTGMLKQIVCVSVQ